MIDFVLLVLEHIVFSLFLDKFKKLPIMNTSSSSSQRVNGVRQPLWESSSSLPSLPISIPMTVEEVPPPPQPQQQTIKEKQKRLKRCHGNRKIQRFRQKCRAKGMKPPTIAKQVKKRFNAVENQTTQLTTHDNNEVKNNSIAESNNKRKRDLTTDRVVRSTSEMSILQQSSVKKQKKTEITATTNNIAAATTTTSINSAHNNNIYRCAPYLKTLSSALLQALRLQLDHTLKKKFEQIFVYKRLQLLDQQFSLELHQSLWQSYMNMGSQYQVWPVSRILLFFLVNIIL